MEKMNVVEILFISLNQNITFIGKLWLAVFLLLRVFVLLFAGLPLFWDEGEKFVCNTIHPGCISVCLDAFAPLSMFRFGFLHLMCACLPTVLYVTHHTHRVLSALTRRYFLQDHPFLPKPQITTLRRTEFSSGGGLGGSFTGSYVLQIIVRIFLEMAFGAGQYFQFGVLVRRDFLCLQAPCSPAVECFTSRPTEKTFLLQWMLGNVVMSVLISISDMLIVLRRSAREKKRLKKKVEDKGKRKGTGRSKSDFISKENSTDKTALPLSSASVLFKRKMPLDDLTLSPSQNPKSWNKAPSRSLLHRDSPENSSEKHSNDAVLFSAERMRLRKDHCGKNGSVKSPLTALLNGSKVETWSPALTCAHQAGHYTPATTTTEHHSDSSESQERKAWV